MSDHNTELSLAEQLQALAALAHESISVTEHSYAEFEHVVLESQDHDRELYADYCADMRAAGRAPVAFECWLSRDCQHWTDDAD